MTPDNTPGARLKGYIEARWGRAKGGMETLAQAAGLRGRQTLYEWFAGGEPSLASLQQVAEALGVRRVDLIAAMDGVTAPETEETPRPEWAEGLVDDVVYRWSQGDAPKWALSLTTQITEAIKDERAASRGAEARALATEVASVLRELLPQLRGGSVQVDADP